MKWLNKNLNWAFPLVFTIIITVPLVIWLRIDTNLPHWDMGRHLFNTLQYKNLWGEFFSGQKNLFDVLGYYIYYPPVVHNLALIFYAIFGISQDSAVYSNILWLFILLFSVFNISNKLWGVRSGLIAMLVAASSPILIGQIREFQIDFPLTSIFALSLFLFLKAENFTNRKYSILSGVVAGIGMFVKWTYLAYAGPAVVLFLILGLRDKNKRKLVMNNFLTALSITILICGYWYIKNFELIKHDFATNGIKVAKQEGDPTGMTGGAFSWYFKNINRYYLYLPLALLFLASIFSSITNRKRFNASWPFFLLMIIYYFIFSTLPNKDIRYIMPIIVLIAILISSLMVVSKKKVFQFGLFFLLGLIFILNNAVVPFGQYWDAKDKEVILFENTNYSYYGVVLSDVGGYTVGSPRQQLCPLEEMVQQIPEQKKARLLGEDAMYSNDWDFGFLLLKNNRVFSRNMPIEESDYLVFKDGPSWPSSIDNMQLRNRVTVLKVYECRDGFNIYLTKLNK